MKIKYSYLEKEGLFIIKYFGIFSIEDHFAFSQFRYDTKKFDYQNLKATLTDLRDVNMNFPPADLERLRKFRNTNKKNNAHVVFLVDNPRETAITHIYRQKMTEQGFDYSYCSTLFRACELIDIGIEEAELSNHLDNLIHSFSSHAKN